MRYLVISACVDARNGKEFEAGDEFLPEPTDEQAERLVKAGCLRNIPDNAPPLPGSDDTAQVIADLRDKVTKTAIEAGAQISALDNRVAEVTKQLEDANSDLAGLRGERDQLAQRVDELEKKLAKANKPAAQDELGEADQSKAEAPAEQPAKPVKTKG